jgi:hypothetical protein
MPTESKLDQVDKMFKIASKPKTVIEDIDPIIRLGCIYDSTIQGENGLLLATDLAKTLHLPLTTFTTDDYYYELKKTIDEINNKETETNDYIKQFSMEEDLDIETHVLMSGKIKKVFAMMDKELEEEDKLSRLIMDMLIDSNFSLLIAGSPLMRAREDTGTLGYYMSILLKNPKIHSNFFLVPDQLTKRGEMILGFTSYRQKEGSIPAIIRRGLSIRTKSQTIKIIGLIEENTVATIAKSELGEDESELESQIIKVSSRISDQFIEKFEDIEINPKFELDFNYSIESGNLTSMVKDKLEANNPSFVMVRSVSTLDEHLHSEAEAIARIALAEGYPVLILFD